MADSAKCHIVAWDGWQENFPHKLRELYKERYRQRVGLAWTQYVGGGELVDALDEFVSADIVVADREVLLGRIRDGQLIPLSDSVEADRVLIAEYPDWLRPWAITDHGRLYALPVRWGTTAFLVKADLVSRRKRQLSVKEMLAQSATTLLWTPNLYFLPSLALIAMAVNPNTPLTLSGTELADLERTLEGLAARTAIPVRGTNEFGRIFRDTEPDVVTCAGDWVIKSMEASDPETYELMRRRYVYSFPRDGKPFMFFEMAAILSSSRDTQTARRVIEVMTREPFRRFVEHSGVKSGFYTSNPTVTGELVVGPGFSRCEPSKLIRMLSPRVFPRDNCLRPTYVRWRHIWDTFLDSCETRDLVTGNEAEPADASQKGV